MEFERLLADGFVREIALGQADTLDQTLGEQFAGSGLHVDDLVFDRRRAAVEYQYYHFKYELLRQIIR